VSVQALHELGARKFTLVGLGPLGCIPHEISTHGKNNSLCVKWENNAAQLFNDKLKALVDRFNKELPDAKFIIVGAAKSNDVKLTGTSIYLNIFSSHKIWF
jgi:hypothetical protein